MDREGRSAAGIRSVRTPAPPAAQQVDGGAEFKERVSRSLDALHARDRIEDDVLLLRRGVGYHLVQLNSA